MVYHSNKHKKCKSMFNSLICFLLQVMLLLFSTFTSHLCNGKSPIEDDESDVVKQYRLFGKYPITELLQDEQLTDDSLAGTDPLASSYGTFRGFVPNQRLGILLL